MSGVTLVAPAPGTLRRLLRLPLAAPYAITACLVVVGVVLVMVVLGDLMAPYAPSAQDVARGLSTPSLAHPLGTDLLGRDILSRVVAGARTAFLGPFVIALGSAVLGNALGLLAGYRGGAIDSSIMRWVDLMWSIPSLLVIVVVEGVVGGGYWLSVALLLILYVPFQTRVIRGSALAQTGLPYVEAARVLGVPGRRIMFLHIWPNLSGAAIANTFLVFTGSIIWLSGLSFLGVGVSPGTPDWGLMLSESRAYLFVNPVGVLAPGLMIVLLATALSLIGDWLQERLTVGGAAR